MSHCENCSGGCEKCGSCGGCDGALTMSKPELDVLLLFGEIPFLPVARKAGDMTPVFREENDYSPEEYSLILQCLEKKGLIQIDYSAPLQGADMSRYSEYPVHGSMALTARGIRVLELIDIQGVPQ